MYLAGRVRRVLSTCRPRVSIPITCRRHHRSDIICVDYLFNSTLFARYNPNNAPVTQDLAVRRVPLSQIKPELLEKDGKLAEAFCAGVWSGLGMSSLSIYIYFFFVKKLRSMYGRASSQGTDQKLFLLLSSSHRLRIPTQISREKIPQRPRDGRPSVGHARPESLDV